MTGSSVVIALDGVSVQFGEQVGLSEVSMTVEEGRIVGLVGPSGCGKTTLIRVCIGVLAPTSGALRVFGIDPLTTPTSMRRRFGYMPQLPMLFPNLSVWGSLTFAATIYGLPWRGRRARLEQLLDLVGLGDDRRKLVSECSGGMQRRLSLACTLVHRPQLLFLDEPTAGIDPILRERFWDHFRALRDQGTTIVVSTQYVGEAAACDEVAVMAHGRLLALSPPEGLEDRAFGGRPISVRFAAGWISEVELGRLAALPHVSSVRRTREGDLVVVVDDEQQGIDAIRRHAASSSLPLDEVAPLEPDMDRVFVELVSGAS